MDDYPKTLYPRVGGGSVTVESKEQEKRLGEGWVPHPPFPTTPEPAVAVQPKKRGRPKKVIETIEAS